MWQTIHARLKKHGAWIVFGIFVGYIVGILVASEPPEEEWRVCRLTPEGHPKSQVVFYEDENRRIRDSNLLFTRFILRTREGLSTESNAVLQIQNNLPFDIKVNSLQLVYSIQPLFNPSELIEREETIPSKAEQDIHLYLKHPERYKTYIVDVIVHECEATDREALIIEGSRGKYFVFVWSNKPIDEIIAEIQRLGY